jgi:hypothetical protein
VIGLTTSRDEHTAPVCTPEFHCFSGADFGAERLRGNDVRDDAAFRQHKAGVRLIDGDHVRIQLITRKTPAQRCRIEALMR